MRTDSRKKLKGGILELSFDIFNTTPVIKCKIKMLGETKAKKYAFCKSSYAIRCFEFLRIVSCWWSDRFSSEYVLKYDLYGLVLKNTDFSFLLFENNVFGKHWI